MVESPDDGDGETVGSGEIRVGTASWTDPEFIKAGWYPDDVKNDAEGRLRYYAERLAMVEVNASFYALPRIETVAAWAERTPPGFRFHMKAHQLISGHRTDPARLPAPLRELPADRDGRGLIRRPSRELRDAAIDALLEACGPLEDKLGAILLQLPPSVRAGGAERAEVARIIDRLKPARTAVEFRHRSWVEDGHLEPTLEALSERDAAWVIVDTPQTADTALPTIPEVTSPALAYMRLHGRNTETWTGSKTVAERFNYVYSEDELDGFIDDVQALAERAQEVAVVFNNNSRDYALRNAVRLRELIESGSG